MQQSQRDLENAFQQMRTEPKQQSLIDVLGYDTQGSYKFPQQIQITSATSEISTGGLAVSNASMTINVRDSEVILDCYKTAVQFYYKQGTGSLPDNILSMFQLNSYQIGNVVGVIPEGQLYLQAELFTSSKDDIGKNAQGMLVDLRESDTIATNEEPFPAQYAQKNNYARIVKVSNGTWACSIPLVQLCPALKSINDGQIYLGLGQSLQIQLQMQERSKFVLEQIAGTAVAPVYSIERSQLFKVFTKADQFLQSQILKSSIPFWKPDVYMSKQPFAPSITYMFNVSAKHNVKGFWLGTPWKADKIYTSTAANKSAAANALAVCVEAEASAADKVSYYKNPTTYWPCTSKFISSIQINFAGTTISVNSQQCESLFHHKAFSTNEDLYAHDDVRKIMHDCVYFPLDRFGIDLVGSSSQSGQLQISIQVSYTPNVAIDLVDGLPYSEELITQMSGTLVGIAFLDCHQEAILEHGLYKLV